MNREEFVDFLLDNNCEIVRKDKSGYWVMRNMANMNICGLPVNNPLRPATVCRICKTLELNELPDNDAVHAAKAVVDYVHGKYTI